MYHSSPVMSSYIAKNVVMNDANVITRTKIYHEFVNEKNELVVKRSNIVIVAIMTLKRFGTYEIKWNMPFLCLVGSSLATNAGSAIILIVYHHF